MVYPILKNVENKRENNVKFDRNLNKENIFLLLLRINNTFQNYAVKTFKCIFKRLTEVFEIFSSMDFRFKNLRSETVK